MSPILPFLIVRVCSNPRKNGRKFLQDEGEESFKQALAKAQGDPSVAEFLQKHRELWEKPVQRRQ
jgi:hypothetical protein